MLNKFRKWYVSEDRSLYITKRLHQKSLNTRLYHKSLSTTVRDSTTNFSVLRDLWPTTQVLLTTCLPYSKPVRHHIPASSRHKCWVGSVRMIQHRNWGGAEASMHHSNTSYKAFMPWRGWLWCLTITKTISKICDVVIIVWSDSVKYLSDLTVRITTVTDGLKHNNLAALAGNHIYQHFQDVLLSQ